MPNVALTVAVRLVPVEAEHLVIFFFFFFLRLMPPAPS